MAKFKPKVDHPYWMINSRFEIQEAVNNGSKKSNQRIEAGNCFKNTYQAELFLLNIKHRVSLSRYEHLKEALKGGIKWPDLKFFR